MNYTDPTTVWGDWFGLHAAAARLGWSLALCLLPGGAERYEASREGSPTRRFGTRAAVVEWVDDGAPDAPLWETRRAA